MKEIPVTVDNKRWRLAYRPLGYEKPTQPGQPRKKILGKCDPPNSKDKHIWIDPQATRDDECHMRVILHEMLHATVWSLDEAYVDMYSEVAARTLYRRGFRLTEG